MGVTQLAHEFGVSYGVAARWVAEDEAKRVVPMPKTLVKLADYFDLDVVEVFRRAGFLPALDERPETPQRQDVIRLERRLRRMLLDTPPGRWGAAAILAEAVLDHLAVLLSRVDHLDV
jgi:hypothetical protein